METPELTHIPNGSMCVECARIKEDCSSLPFLTMKPIGKWKSWTIVICTAYQKKEIND